MENHLTEMLTATVSHEMRTPLNIIISVLSSFDKYVPDINGKRQLKII